MTPLADGLTRVTATVANHGYLPTMILASAKDLTHNEPLWMDVRCDGCELADPALAHLSVGRISTAGAAAFFSGAGAIYYAFGHAAPAEETHGRSPGSCAARVPSTSPPARAVWGT